MQELGLAPAKLLSFFISEGFAKPHPMFASGTGSQVSSAAQQAIYFRLRKKPQVATERLCNQLMHGVGHGDIEDREVDEILVATGVPRELVNLGHTLSYAQASTAARTGIFPDGSLLQPELFGHIGRMAVICLSGSQEALDLARTAKQLHYHSISHVYECAHLPSEYLTALALRLLASSELPYAMDRSEIIHRLTAPIVSELVNSMALLESGSLHALSDDQMLEVATATAPAGPWCSR